ncbi:hypothetical protein MATL_G00239180 [Megalops atlanticus]|uniref:Uncharacterized protein n=1 Tax=Megalops atlanticus TaxID=7932 RepID=A0A9D3PGC1_MEGAT|nr:hypothetical protein MATL_G00239180 [Megalops atlanticus]
MYSKMEADVVNAEVTNITDVEDSVEEHLTSGSEYKPGPEESCSSSESEDNQGRNCLTAGKRQTSQKRHVDIETVQCEETSVEGMSKSSTQNYPDSEMHHNPTDEAHQTKRLVVKTCSKTSSGKRKWDKKHYCVYCNKPNAKLARHLERKHSKEIDVAQALSFPKGSKRRSMLLEKLRNKGDYYHNVNVLKEGTGEFVTWRQPSASVAANEYLPCQHCFGFFVKNDLWRHQGVCKFKTKTKGTSKNRVQSVSSELLPLPNENIGGCKEILHKMQQDEVSLHAKHDPLICKFGDMLFAKHGHDQTQHTYIATKMRELSRFVLAIQEIDHSIKFLQDIIMPSRFSLAVEGVKKVGGYDTVTNKYKVPSLTLKIGYSLKKAADIAVGEAVIAEDVDREQKAKKFIQLMESKWNSYVSSHALSTLHHAKWNKVDVIPLTEDVVKLQKFLQVSEEKAKKELEKNPCPDKWRRLNEVLLAEIILFNRRREGEAAKMLLETYMKRDTTPMNLDVFDSLSKLEQQLSSTLTRIEIRGKRGRKVPVLLTKSMVSSMEVLIHFRREVGVPEENPYMFARMEANSHIRGCDCLRKFASECGAKYPENLTSTKLRKHVATVCQIMNLKENELDQVAKFLGHDIRVHREYYRLSENTLQLAKISKLFLGIEKGSTVLKGKSLEELDLPMEDNHHHGCLHLLSWHGKTTKAMDTNYLALHRKQRQVQAVTALCSRDCHNRIAHNHSQECNGGHGLMKSSVLLRSILSFEY